MQGFNKLTLYTNLSLLKKYIAHDMIVAPMVLGEYSYSLSDTGTADMLLFGKCANAGFIKDKYRADNAETPVAITLYLSDTAEVIALDDRGGRHPGRLADLSEYNFFLVHKPISFHNVISVTAVSGELIFLQGDSTVRVPEEIIDRGTYMPAETIDGGVIESILAAVGCERDAEGSQGDISDDEDVNLSELYSRLAGQEEAEEDIVKFRRADRLLAALLMLVQGTAAQSHKLSPELYEIFGQNRPFADYVAEELYSPVKFDISAYLPQTNAIFVQYYRALKASMEGDKSESVYWCAIDALLSSAELSRQEFRELFLENIADDGRAEKVKSYLSNERARACLEQFKEQNNGFLPIYFLYMFYGCDFDRLLKNFTEFGIGFPFSNIVLSLWALGKGLGGVYEEYKAPDVLYACSKKAEALNPVCSPIIGIEPFMALNKITLTPDEFILDNYRYFYRNIAVEYHFCAGNANKKADELIERLRRLLDDTFGFDYAGLKQALSCGRNSQAYVVHGEEVHKRYVQLTAKYVKKPKKQSPPRKKQTGQLTIDGVFTEEKGTDDK